MTILPFIIVGIAAGSVYALAGVGLVLIYKTSGIFNFAFGAVATIGAYVFYSLHVQRGMAWLLAAVIAGPVVGVFIGMVFETFGRSLSRVTIAWQVASTVAIALTVEAVLLVLYGSTTLTFPHFLPQSGFEISGAHVTYEQVIIVAISILATGGLYLFLRTARTGKAMRAAVDDPDLLNLAGTNPVAVRRWAWIIGSVFATISGLLLAPSVSLDPNTLTLLVVQAFGAAAIGGFSSLPLTWLGGLAIGVVGSVISQYGPSGSVLSGLPPSLPFIVLFLVLVFSPRRRLVTREAALIRPKPRWLSPAPLQLAMGAVLLIALALVPQFVGYQVDQWTIVLTDTLILVSLGFLVRTAGQVSLCQLAFAAIGASAMAKFATELGVPWFLALILAGIVAIPFGVLLAVPAIRFSGIYLALATFGFGLVLQDMFYNTNFMFGSSAAGSSLQLPKLPWLGLGSQKSLYYITLIISTVLIAGVVLLTRSRFGRLMRAIAESPRGLTASGTNVRVSLILAFCISVFIAAIAGALNGTALQEVNGLNFPPMTSVLFMAVVMIGPGNEPWYALVPALAIVLLPTYFTSPNVGYYLQMTFGFAAVAGAITGQPTPGWLLRVRAGVDRRMKKSYLASADGDTAPEPVIDGTRSMPVSAGIDEIQFEVRELTVRFGGLAAVQGMSLHAETGVITGLIGPNGAGKTTTLNVCSGFQKADGGAVLLNDRDITSIGPATRARLGLGRTFQQMELFNSMTVFENVLLGCEGAVAGARLPSQIFSSRRDKPIRERRVREAIEFCGIADFMDAEAGSLSTGQQRLVELARALAGPFRILLLDEPSSGLDRTETIRIGETLRQIVRDRGIGILMVEHDMELVMDICETIYVMDFGRPLFSGTPQEVRASEVVRSAYLGTSGETLATTPVE
jgi:ABC-type branched-subunit amino acid transport system ATPase component/branched-subunit amino acid ABC-type transport system permease component